MKLGQVIENKKRIFKKNHSENKFVFQKSFISSKCKWFNIFKQANSIYCNSPQPDIL